jgi:hypothetical protein
MKIKSENSEHLVCVIIYDSDNAVGIEAKIIKGEIVCWGD